MLRTLGNRLFGATLSIVLGIALAVGVTISAQEATPEAATPEPMEVAELEVTLIDQQGEEVGNATFHQVDDLVTITVTVEAGTLEPGERGIHIHQTGICDPDADPPFDSAGGHFNPLDVEHGAPILATPGATPAPQEAHAGDLGNIVVEEDGSAQFELTTDQVTLEPGQETSLDDADGSALVIHAERDDLETDPTGESGERLLCGVIFPAEVAETAVTVEAVDIDFNPNEFTIAADTDVSVTLINTGSIEHTFSIDELDIDVVLAPGEETEITINAAAGEYEYFCRVPGHRESGQVGTMTVE